jgi:hypothetical protein
MEKFFEESFLDDTTISKQKLKMSVLLSTSEIEKVEQFHYYFNKKFKDEIIEKVYDLAVPIEKKYNAREHLTFAGTEIMTTEKLTEEHPEYSQPDEEDDSENWQCIKYDVTVNLDCTAVGWFLLRTCFLSNNLRFDF